MYVNRDIHWVSMYITRMMPKTLPKQLENKKGGPIKSSFLCAYPYVYWQPPENPVALNSV